MNFLTDRACLSASIAVIGAGTGLYLWKLYTTPESLPSQWRAVGELGDMMCFPVKSCGNVKLNKMECTIMGLKLGEMRDRNFMIINKSGDFVTARFYPRLVLIKPKIVDNDLILDAPEMESISINMSQINNNENIKSTLWGQPLDCIDCGDAVNKWLSRFILKEETGLRLVHYSQGSNEIKRSRERSIVKDTDSGAFPDLTSYCLINENSIKDLNGRLTDYQTKYEDFRPNFIVKGVDAFEEDHWRWLRIGDVIFKVVKNCTRCILTTVDSSTGIRNKSGEPIKTLRTYRIVEDPKAKSLGKNTLPVMGIHLALRKNGEVELGDTVYVA